MHTAQLAVKVERGMWNAKLQKALSSKARQIRNTDFVSLFIPLFLISPLGIDKPDKPPSKSAPKKFATKMRVLCAEKGTGLKKYTTASGRDGDKYQLWANANEILNTSSFKHCSSYFISFYRKYNLFKGKLFTFKVYLFHSKIISSLSCSFNVPFSFSWQKFVRTKCRNSSAPHILCQLLTTVPPLLSPFSSSC